MQKRIIDQLLEKFQWNQTKAAQALGKGQSHVWYWQRPGKDLPLELVPKAAKILGKTIQELRPDLFE